MLLAGEPPGDHAFLSDFGLTKRTASAGSLTAAGQVVGTVDFIAPQQPRGDPADARADIYALGGLLYQALTGRVPFPCDGDLATMWAYLHEDPPKATRWVPELPASIDDVLARAQLSVGSQSAGGERRIERLLSAHTTFRLQLRSLQAYLIDAICAHSRANPIPLLI